MSLLPLPLDQGSRPCFSFLERFLEAILLLCVLFLHLSTRFFYVSIFLTSPPCFCLCHRNQLSVSQSAVFWMNELGRLLHRIFRDEPWSDLTFSWIFDHPEWSDACNIRRTGIATVNGRYLPNYHTNLVIALSHSLSLLFCYFINTTDCICPSAQDEPSSPSTKELHEWYMYPNACLITHLFISKIIDILLTWYCLDCLKIHITLL